MNYKNNIVNGIVLGDLEEKPFPGFADFTRKVAADGIVLLKNNAVLPLQTGTRVSVFGRIQTNYYKSGTGSGGRVNVAYVTNILDSLRASDTIKVNETLASVYAEWAQNNPFDHGNGWSEPWCQIEMPLSEKMVEEASEKSEVALVIIGRTAGEDKDNTPTEGSYLLSVVERENLKKVTKVFQKVCVILNVGNIIDMKWVDECNVDAVLYVWQGGMEGGNAAVDVLTGKVTPSGKLSDTIASDINDYPSTKNFGNPEVNVYAEDIYVGYRYFETVCKEKVLYPFGFGLSYTTFSVIVSEAATTKDTITVKTVVTNTGTYSGKEVVQLYYGAPQGKLGKPAKELIAFSKTKLLRPNESELVSLTIKINDMASYDDSGVTGNKTSYVLESGDYKLYLGTDILSAVCVLTYNNETLIVTEKLTEVMAPVMNFERYRPFYKDGAFQMETEAVPTRTIDLDRRIKDTIPKEIPFTGDQGICLCDVLNSIAKLEDFIAQFTDEDLACISRGEGMNSPKVTAGTGCAFGGVTDKLIDFGIPAVCGTDGPSGIRLESGAIATAMPNGTLLACTWDQSLVEELYVLEGIEMTAYKIDVILGPGINIHRNPLNGRNFEYFSEDPLLTGKIGAAIARGLDKAGVACTLKHFLGNNQEFNRYSADSIISERAIREIYAKAFRIAIQEGNALSVMTSYNPVNGFWTASNYDLNTTLLRSEWGFSGFVMSDWWAVSNDEGEKGTKENLKAMVRAQNDIYMVCSDAYTNKDNILESLATGLLSRSELQRNAMNICHYVMKTHAFERFVTTGGVKQNLLSNHLEQLTTVYKTEELTSIENVKVYLKESGQFLLALKIKSDAPVLTQSSVRIAVNEHSAASVTVNGTEGKSITKFAEIFLLKGETSFTLTYSKESLTIVGLQLLK